MAEVEQKEETDPKKEENVVIAANIVDGKVVVPSFDYFFDVFGRYFKYYGLDECHLVEKSKSKSFRAFQSMLYKMTVVILGYAFTAEVFYLSLFIRDTKIQLTHFRFISEVIGCATSTLVACFKAVFLGLKGREIIEIMTELRHMHEGVVDEEEKRLCVAVIVPARFVFRTYGTLLVVTATLYSFCNTFFNLYDYFYSPDVAVVWDLPFYVWYPWDIYSSPLVFWATYTTNFAAGIDTGLILITFDIYFAYITCNVVMHFDRVCYKLSQVGLHEPGLTFEEREAIDLKRIKTVVEMHTTLLKLCDLSENIFGFPLLMNTCTFSVIICTLCFVIQIAPAQYLPKYVFFLGSCIIQLFMISYYGDNLKASSGAIATCAFNSNWIEASPRVKTSIMILIGKGNVEKAFSVMGYAEISMLTMTGVLKVAGSYYALLKTVYEKKMEEH